MEENPTQINGGITIYFSIITICRYQCKTRHICEKDYIWNPFTCILKNGKDFACIVLWMTQRLCVIKL